MADEITRLGMSCTAAAAAGSPSSSMQMASLLSGCLLLSSQQHQRRGCLLVLVLAAAAGARAQGGGGIRPAVGGAGKTEEQAPSEEGLSAQQGEIAVQALASALTQLKDPLLAVLAMKVSLPWPLS